MSLFMSWCNPYLHHSDLRDYNFLDSSLLPHKFFLKPSHEMWTNAVAADKGMKSLLTEMNLLGAYTTNINVDKAEV